MSMVKKSISITEKQNGWVKSQIISGDFGNKSEVVRALIRKEQKQLSSIQAIRKALIEGEESGISNRNMDDIKDAVLKRRE